MAPSTQVIILLRSWDPTQANFWTRLWTDENWGIILQLFFGEVSWTRITYMYLQKRRSVVETGTVRQSDFTNFYTLRLKLFSKLVVWKTVNQYIYNSTFSFMKTCRYCTTLDTLYAYIVYIQYCMRTIQYNTISLHTVWKLYIREHDKK